MVRYSESLEHDVEELVSRARELGLEGLVAKRPGGLAGYTVASAKVISLNAWARCKRVRSLGARLRMHARLARTGKGTKGGPEFGHGQRASSGRTLPRQVTIREQLRLDLLRVTHCLSG